MAAKQMILQCPSAAAAGNPSGREVRTGKDNCGVHSPALNFSKKRILQPYSRDDFAAVGCQEPTKPVPSLSCHIE